MGIKGDSIMAVTSLVNTITRHFGFALDGLILTVFILVLVVREIVQYRSDKRQSGIRRAITWILVPLSLLAAFAIIQQVGAAI
jgi:beta-lactamase regulating signal transducer with metallopeptidase domain